MTHSNTAEIWEKPVKAVAVFNGQSRDKGNPTELNINVSFIFWGGFNFKRLHVHMMIVRNNSEQNQKTAVTT